MTMHNSIKKYLIPLIIIAAAATTLSVFFFSRYRSQHEKVLKQAAYEQLLPGYKLFRKKYIDGDRTLMNSLFEVGQKPKIMMVACSDSRVDPAVLFQASPGDFFVVRNVANFIPSFAKNKTYYSELAALEYGINFLKIPHLIIMGHSECGGLQYLLAGEGRPHSEFILPWVALAQTKDMKVGSDAHEYAKEALKL
jgi:carbonic anhydrase